MRHVAAFRETDVPGNRRWRVSLLLCGKGRRPAQWDAGPSLAISPANTFSASVSTLASSHGLRARRCSPARVRSSPLLPARSPRAWPRQTLPCRCPPKKDGVSNGSRRTPPTITTSRGFGLTKGSPYGCGRRQGRPAGNPQWEFHLGLEPESTRAAVYKRAPCPPPPYCAGEGASIGKYNALAAPKVRNLTSRFRREAAARPAELFADRRRRAALRHAGCRVRRRRARERASHALAHRRTRVLSTRHVRVRTSTLCADRPRTSAPQIPGARAPARSRGPAPVGARAACPCARANYPRPRRPWHRAHTQRPLSARLP